MRAVLPGTEEGRSIFMAIQRGDLTGMSFSFKCEKDGSLYDTKTNTRTISKISNLYECSVVPFPAYQSSSVEARSQIDEAKQREIVNNLARIKINQILKRSV